MPELKTTIKPTKHSELTAELVRQLLIYDPETGALTWRRRGREWFPTTSGWKIFNARCAGKTAFTTLTNGYCQGSIFQLQMQAHRLAWLYMTGQHAELQIDHANGVRNDNRWANLRLATDAQQRQNSKRHADNKSGCKGVSWSKQWRKWRAIICVNGKNVHLGGFNSKDEAFWAYAQAANKHFGEFARLN